MTPLEVQLVHLADRYPDALLWHHPSPLEEDEPKTGPYTIEEVLLNLRADFASGAMPKHLAWWLKGDFFASGYDVLGFIVVEAYDPEHDILWGMYREDDTAGMPIGRPGEEFRQRLLEERDPSDV